MSCNILNSRLRLSLCLRPRQARDGRQGEWHPEDERDASRRERGNRCEVNAEKEEPEEEESLKNQSNQKASLVQVTAILRVWHGLAARTDARKNAETEFRGAEEVSRKN